MRLSFARGLAALGITTSALAWLAMPELSQAASTGVRSLFLNGVDISSARSQDLRGVDIHINEAGDIFIIAPHYQVNEEDAFIPLSKFVQSGNAPEHKPPQAVSTPAMPLMSATAPAAPTTSAAPKKIEDPPPPPLPEEAPLTSQPPADAP